MASNPYVNKVEYAGQTVMDLTGDTVTPSDVLSGVTFHDRSGAPQTGSMNPISFLVLKSGTQQYSKLYASGFITGSGNYMDLYIPCDASNVTNVVAEAGVIHAKLTIGDDYRYYNVTSVGFIIVENGVVVEFPVSSTLTNAKGRPMFAFLENVSFTCT